MKVKMYGQKRFSKQPNNPRDLRWLKKERQRENNTPKTVAAQIRKEKEGQACPCK
jgi:hypothetical protein